jgi:hypothetical protein
MRAVLKGYIHVLPLINFVLQEFAWATLVCIDIEILLQDSQQAALASSADTARELKRREGEVFKLRHTVCCLSKRLEVVDRLQLLDKHLESACVRSYTCRVDLY